MTASKTIKECAAMTLTPPHGYTLVTSREHPELQELARGVVAESWPGFMLPGFESNDYWNSLHQTFPDFQFALINDSTGDPVAVGNSVPLPWGGSPRELPEEGWDWALTQAFGDHRAGQSAYVQCALAISVAPASRRAGLSAHMIRAMKSIGAARGFRELYAPLRPFLKSLYPLTSIESYVQWKDVRGLPFDPWMRVHVRLGGEVVRPCVKSMRITYSVDRWELLTGLRFPESGLYVVPNALTPVEVDRALNIGTYVEPNVWLRHALA
jgi:hypothetical protein